MNASRTQLSFLFYSKCHMCLCSILFYSSRSLEYRWYKLNKPVHIGKLCLYIYSSTSFILLKILQTATTRTSKLRTIVQRQLGTQMLLFWRSHIHTSSRFDKHMKQKQVNDNSSDKVLFFTNKHKNSKVLLFSSLISYSTN